MCDEILMEHLLGAQELAGGRARRGAYAMASAEAIGSQIYGNTARAE